MVVVADDEPELRVHTGPEVLLPVALPHRLRACATERQQEGGRPAQAMRVASE